MQPNIVTTRCSECVFNKKTCSIGRENFSYNEYKFTEGYCRFKRIEEKSLNQIIEEENRLCIIILITDFNVEKFIDTLDSVKKYATEIIVSVLDAKREYIQEVVNELKKSGAKWKLNNINSKAETEPLTDLYLVDRTIQYSENANWFLTLFSGDILSDKTFMFFRNMISGKQNNALIFYFNEKDHIRIITNKLAFIEIAGNMGISFFDKINKFNNKDKLCIQIN